MSVAPGFPLSGPRHSPQRVRQRAGAAEAIPRREFFLSFRGVFVQFRGAWISAPVGYAKHFYWKDFIYFALRGSQRTPRISRGTHMRLGGNWAPGPAPRFALGSRVCEGRYPLARTRARGTRGDGVRVGCRGRAGRIGDQRGERPASMIGPPCLSQSRERSRVCLWVEVGE